MTEFDSELRNRLGAIRAEGLWRQLRRVDSPQGHTIRMRDKWLLNFASNDYLGFADDPRLKEAAARALERFGSGSGASRLISGSLAIHHELEEALAEFKHLPAALSFSSGYATAAGAICALMGKGDIIILDRLVHACMIDAARLCGAKIRVFAHNNLEQLEAVLKWGAARAGNTGPKSHMLIVTESVFSMDGDLAPLREIVALKDKYRAWLMVDEAHGTGLFGPTRRGVAEAAGVSDQIEIHMGTLGKALGSAGGYICGSRNLIDFLTNRARSFIFSTAPVPAAAAAATAAIRLVQSHEGEVRCQILWQRVAELAARLPAKPRAGTSAIIPLHVGNEGKAMRVFAALLERGFLVPAVRYPTVARGKARLRLTVSASHEPTHLADLCTVLSGLPELSSSFLQNA